MIRLSPNKSKHTLATQILAMGLSFVVVAGTLPPVSSSAPVPIAAQVHHAWPIPAAIPPVALQPPDPVPTPPDDEKEARKWGEITVGQPKIWQYERVNSLLDGLLRDVEGVSLSDLVGLDPNVSNGAAVKFVQSMLEIGVKYDQSAAVTNNITLQNYAASQGVVSAQIEANKGYLQQLNQQRSTLSSQLVEAMELNSSLQTQLANTNLDPSSAEYKALSARQQAAAGEVTSLTSDLNAINSQITSATATTMPPAPSLMATAPASAPENPNTFSSFLGNLPPDLTKNIVSQLQSPSLPATKRLDNFITLLYERLAREISVLQDDVMRDPDNVPFLVQFDVGLYPASQAKNHVGVVEFSMDCTGCKVYSIYPGQSSYNLSNYEGASKRYSFWGALQTLFGFGISGDYRRQQDTLRGDLVQSVYISGFQESAAKVSRYKAESENADQKTKGVPTKERFGWYYGSAPFETEVSPGIRTTFAVVSIPRTLIKECTKQGACSDPDGSKKLSLIQEVDGLASLIDLKINAHADWVKRDDPYYQNPQKWYKPGWVGSSYIGGPGEHGVNRELKVVLPGTDAINITPEIVFRERNRLHVTGIEYNTVYLPATPPGKGKPDSGANTAPPSPSPGTTQGQATGTGAGTATVTVTGSGIVTATTSGSGGTAANASAASPPTAKAGGGNDSSTDSFTGCKKYECAAVLIKLAEPIDPNVVVTVRGEPLRRVRDWRGRATSILPPVQSASDMPPSPAGATTGTSTSQQQRSENPSSRSLLEADQSAPNTWMEVDSHRLLLTISKELAGVTDFPSIQIVDPAKRALFIPLDLDQGFSEVITNGFHLSTRNEEQLRIYICTHVDAESPATRPADCQRSGTLLPLRPSGPYPYAMFLPLFEPERDSQEIYAYLGESGVQLLIGFADDTLDSATASPREGHKWLSSQTQVILEDRDLDLAWSLTCYPQGPQLVCDIPRHEMSVAYQIVRQICNSGTPSPACPSIFNSTQTFPSISTLQLWVDQFDPDGNESFYTPVPARLGRFPVARHTFAAPAGDPGADVGFKPWHFEAASPEWVKLAECQYPHFPPTGNAVVTLGRHIPPDYRTQALVGGPENGCAWFAIPSAALARTEVVIEYETDTSVRSTPLTIPPNPPAPPVRAGTIPCSQPAPTVPCVPESLLTLPFRPFFEEARIVPVRSTRAPFRIEMWKVDMLAGQVDCNDSLDLPDTNRLSAKWKIGSTTLDVLGAGSPVRTCPTSPDWQEASRTGQVRLQMEVKRGNLDALLEKRKIHVIRGGDQIEIATLPDIRSLILPTKLKVQSLGKNQFALQGTNAEVIDAVSLQGPNGPFDLYSVATGAGVALVSLPQPPKKPAGPPAPPAKTPSETNTPPVLGPGTYTVLPLVSWRTDDGKQLYLALEVKDPDGKPLTYTIADDAQKKSPEDANGTQTGPTTTVTITKKTTSTPAPAPTKRATNPAP